MPKFKNINISIIQWFFLVLLMVETWIPGEHNQTLVLESHRKTSGYIISIKPQAVSN